jgi:hypothetical protein
MEAEKLPLEPAKDARLLLARERIRLGRIPFRPLETGEDVARDYVLRILGDMLLGDLKPSDACPRWPWASSC